ncbi:MAG: hypothetical protein A2498_00900 [Lentisphaerae bacterium RIFOXYC12_FULL_60_16]|nr:MAG: hypothetical protein A2498_00900 [Lentisphaerae bacterium RIFOXYC12_FULL_60_16]
MKASTPTLLALRHLGDLADVRPRIVVDTREQTPLVFTRLQAIRGTLRSGDYSFTGGEESFAIERKSIPDLVSCCAGSNRERFEHELHRLRGYRFKRLVIVGNHSDVEKGVYRSNVKPRAVLASLSAWEVRYDCPVVWTPTPEAAALQVESWAWWFAREIVQDANALLRGSSGPDGQ